MTHDYLDKIEASYREACRKPSDLEAWAFENVPELFRRLREVRALVREYDEEEDDEWGL